MAVEQETLIRSWVNLTRKGLLSRSEMSRLVRSMESIKLRVEIFTVVVLF